VAVVAQVQRSQSQGHQLPMQAAAVDTVTHLAVQAVQAAVEQV
jgi:hypothetical protein